MNNYLLIFPGENINTMQIHDLPNEVISEILEYVPCTMELRVVSKQFNDIASNIRNKVFNDPFKYINELSTPVYYLLEKRKYHNYIWHEAIYSGNLDIITRLSKLGYPFDANIALSIVAREGYKNLVDFFIKKGANDWESGMDAAVEGGHEDLVKFFIDLGAKNWNSGMMSAAMKNRIEWVLFFIDLGANNWDLGMIHAALEGHEGLVKFFINLGATAWNAGLHYAAIGGHKKLMDFFIEKGGDMKSKTRHPALKEYGNVFEFYL